MSQMTTRAKPIYLRLDFSKSKSTSLVPTGYFWISDRDKRSKQGPLRQKNATEAGPKQNFRWICFWPYWPGGHHGSYYWLLVDNQIIRIKTSKFQNERKNDRDPTHLANTGKSSASSTLSWNWPCCLTLSSSFDLFTNGKHFFGGPNIPTGGQFGQKRALRTLLQ